MAVKHTVRLADFFATFISTPESCKAAHCKADIVSTYLCALYSHFLDMREYKIIIHALC